MLKYTDKMHVSVFTGRNQEQIVSALGRKLKGVEAGCCQGWVCCALIFLLLFLSEKDWFYKPGLLPELALG